MQFFKVDVQLAGDAQHVVAGKGPVSVAEIAVLKAVHGDGAVGNYKYLHTVKGHDDRALLDQLKKRYENALPSGREPVVDKLFGPMGVLPKTLQEIGVNPAAEAARRREAAERAAQEADQLLGLADTTEIEVEEDVAAMFADPNAAPAKGKQKEAA